MSAILNPYYFQPDRVWPWAHRFQSDLGPAPYKPKAQLPVCAASAHHRLCIKSRMQMSAIKMVMRSIIQKLTPTEKTHVGLSRSRLNT
jgi:hypothetical protein